MLYFLLGEEIAVLSVSDDLSLLKIENRAEHQFLASVYRSIFRFKTYQHLWISEKESKNKKSHFQLRHYITDAIVEKMVLFFL